MAIRLTEAQIDDLVAEPKPLESHLLRPVLKRKRGSLECDIEVKGRSGRQFRVVIRQGTVNPMSFSAILGFVPPGSNVLFRLRRYNGKYHEHFNTLERERFYEFHIHYATERYQELGGREDEYARPTNRFCDLRGALDCLMQDCGFEDNASPDDQMVLEY